MLVAMRTPCRFGHAATVMAALFALAGCKELPEAPETFAELCAYLYEHHADEDPAALIAGLEQLATWLDEHPEEAEDKYSVDPLTEEIVDSLDDKDRTAEEMVGLAVARQSHHPIEDTTHCLVVTPQDAIYPDTYDEYEREYVGDPDCFMDKECPRIGAMEHLESSFALGVTSVSDAHNQYLWVELERDWAMVHRNWQLEAPVVNLSLLEVDEQTYLDVLVPGESGVWRVQAQWTVYDQDNDIDQGLAENTVVNLLIKCHDEMEAYLDEHDVR